MAHGEARDGKWRRNWRMEWVVSTLTLPRNMVHPALLPPLRTPRLPVVDWNEAPADLNGLVRFAERRNLVSARVPSDLKCSLQTGIPGKHDIGIVHLLVVVQNNKKVKYILHLLDKSFKICKIHGSHFIKFSKNILSRAVSALPGHMVCRTVSNPVCVTVQWQRYGHFHSLLGEVFIWI
jgi:hypothetical protein